MDNRFFEKPVLNSPYGYPARHWELDDQGQPTQRIIEARRRAKFITPIPKPRKRKDSAAQQVRMVFDEGKGLSTQEQQYDPTSIINKLRHHVDQWRSWPNPNDWQVTPETARLLQHWRYQKFNNIRPFFCQVEAVETAIWLAEVAPKAGKIGKSFLEHLANANNDANPDLMRLALKLATGAGKTTVMAMLIAWQTINAVRRPASKKFTRGFLVVTPGLTIRDRLRVLQPNDPDSYYESRELVPHDMLGDLDRAKIIITNYHAFKLRERMELSRGGRSLLQGRGEALNTLETEGQMLQRVMPDLMGIKSIMVLNDEAHHCYRQKPGKDDEGDLKGDDKEEAEKNNEATRHKIFISSVQKELANERRAVKSFIEGDPLLTRFFTVFLFEDLPASDRRADAVYLAEVDQCAVYVGIFGDEYGFEDVGGVSPTEREFERATVAGKPRLIFVKGADDRGRHPKMRLLIDKAGQQLIRRRFGSSNDLTAVLYASLVDYLEETGAAHPGSAASAPWLGPPQPPHLRGALPRPLHRKIWHRHSHDDPREPRSRSA